MRTGATPLLVPTLALLVAFGGCRPDANAAPATSSDEIRLQDADGRTLRLSSPARRVVSLVPSATVTLEAIGAAGVVVARTDHDTASWTRDLPSVGGGLMPSLEAVVAARPDLVVRFGGPQDTRTPGALDQLGLPHLAIRPDGIGDVLETVRLLGAATGHARAADSLAAALRAGLDSVRASTAGLPRVRAAYVLGGDPPWVAGPGTYIHDLLEVAGADNVFADLGSLYAAVSVEEFLARPVDVVVTPRGARLDERIRRRARVVETGDALEIPGPEVASAARALAALLHAPGGP